MKIDLYTFLLFTFLFSLSSKIPAQQQRKTKIHPKTGKEMVYLSAGEFIMGSDSLELLVIWKKMGWNMDELEFTKSEQPAHSVKLDGFWMYTTLVSVGEYRLFALENRLPFPEAPSYGWKEDHPMVNLTWTEANYYCTCQGGRLPTEAEWEYAARAENTGLKRKPRSIFTWGDQYPERHVANLADQTFLEAKYYNHNNFHGFNGYSDGFATASPIKAFPPNSYGLYDMAGNVLEWCADWYSDHYSSELQDNPKGPESGSRKVLRGGAFDTTPTITRIARRLGNHPEIRHEEKGFRCVMD